MSQNASGTFSVNLQPMPFEEVADAAMLARRSINKQIIGDLTATTQGQMLSAGTAIKGSAAYVAIEHVEGRLNGKSGSFVLQHTGIMNRGVPSLTVLVVPDSGTGDLVGIQGEFKINIADGSHSYEFIYSLPEV